MSDQSFEEERRRAVQSAGEDALARLGLSASSEKTDAFVLGWARGVADVGARLVGIVASELGQDSPVVDRMVVAIGRLVDEANEG